MTRIVGWISKSENAIVRDLSIGVWTWLAGDLNLDEARKDAFASLHDCFTRELKEGARPIDPDPDVLVSRATASSSRVARLLEPSSFKPKASPTRSTSCWVTRVPPSATGTGGT